jgi:DNA-binding Lrp family transcriptional regulator
MRRRTWERVKKSVDLSPEDVLFLLRTMKENPDKVKKVKVKLEYRTLAYAPDAAITFAESDERVAKIVKHVVGSLRQSEEKRVEENDELVKVLSDLREQHPNDHFLKILHRALKDEHAREQVSKIYPD